MPLSEADKNRLADWCESIRERVVEDPAVWEEFSDTLDVMPPEHEAYVRSLLKAQLASAHEHRELVDEASGGADEGPLKRRKKAQTPKRPPLWPRPRTH